MRNVILTGGTGFVGAFLAVQLIREGFRVLFLAREKRGVSAERRIRSIIRFVSPDLGGELERHSSVVSCTLTNDGLGLPAESLDDLKALKPEALFHCAASVDFSDRNQASTMLSNVKGTENVCKIATLLNVRRFHHMSTLYVAGTRTGCISEQELRLEGPFNNAYEASKARAEYVVRQWSKGAGIPYIIYRLPIVLGHSLTGTALNFTAYYGFFRPFWRIAQKARKERTPVFVPCGRNATIDLVPVDWIVKTISQVFSHGVNGTPTLHLTHSRPPSSSKVIRQSIMHLGLKGVELTEDKLEETARAASGTAAGYQRLINATMRTFFPYATSTKQFNTEGLRTLLERDHAEPPEINAPLLSRMLDYATKFDFSSPVRI